MAIRRTVVAGVFEQEQQARRALNALGEAGFHYDQIGVAIPALARQRGDNVDLYHDFQVLGIPAEEARYYDQAFRSGRVIISVRADGREGDASGILHAFGGYGYSDRQTAPQNFTSTSTATANTGQPSKTRQDIPPAGAPTAPAQERVAATEQTPAAGEREDWYQQRSLKLREEQLEIDKERVQKGEVTMHKEIVTEEKTITVPVTREEMVIEYAPAPGTEGTESEAQTIRIPVKEEQIQVTKTPVVVNDVDMYKERVRDTQQVSETVRREQLRVEREGDVRVQDVSEAGDNKPDTPRPEH